MEVAPLDERQTEEFFAHYYGAGDPAAQQLLRALRQRRPLGELLRVPYLLTVVAQLYRSQQYIVEDAGRETSRLVFTGEILDKAKQFWESTGRPAYEPHDLAEDVKAASLLREVGPDAYAFSHLTLQEYLAAAELARRPDCEKIFCRAYFKSSLVEMEVLPMTLGLAPRPEKLYAALEQLPESLTSTGLRLRARGLAYVQNLDRELLSRLADLLSDFVSERYREDTPYLGIVAHSFSEVRADAAR